MKVPITRESNEDANRDPLSGSPGAHPVGTGIGAAGAGAAGAALGSAGGPIGAAVGLVVGAIAGGLGGKAVAEKIDPTFEDEYWRENYSTKPYVEKGAPYDAYAPAYRIGYEGRNRYVGKKFEEVEHDLKREYTQSANGSALGWSNARHAARDAWNRADDSAQGGGLNDNR